MNATISYLERLKAAHGGASDYRAAQLLGLKPQTISTWRGRGSQMSTTIAVKVAQLLGLPPIQVIADIELEHARTDDDRQLWEAVKKH